MVRRWIVGVGAAVAVLAMVGVGFSAFTASATVNGTGYAATVDLDVSASHYLVTLCEWFNFTFYTVASISVTPLTPNSIAFSATNMVPDTRCFFAVDVTNVGSVAVSVSETLVPGAGICAPGATNGCFDASTWLYPTDAIAGAYTNSITPSLAPGSTFYDWAVISIPPGWTSAPVSGTFEVVYTATAGV